MPVSTKKQKSMTMPQIQTKARALGIVPGKMKKADLIHTIQSREGNTQCYGKSNGYCPYNDCCFMKDCLKTKL